MSEKNNAAARLRAHTASLEAVVVDVKAPSGFVYKFRKPSKFGLLFQMGTLPQAASAAAINEWQKDGVGPEDGQPVGENLTSTIKAAMGLRDRVLELSYEPKFVVGEAAGENEVSTDEVPDADLEYLFKWVAAGGDASAMLGNFPGGQRAGALASASRRKVRDKAEPASAGA